MAQILPDKEIKKLFDTVLIGVEEARLNPNGIELRLGTHIFFQATQERKELLPGKFVKVGPGESITFSSLEKLDLTSDTVQSIFPNCALMALITPTTTMMREGIAQVSTKIDSGFKGNLNWTLRNSSTKTVVLAHGEPMFKLTLWLLGEEEVPEVYYGERESDKYQNTEGIVRSKRQIPADIAEGDILSSSQDKMDPQKRLAEEGYPFNFIASELKELHGQFEIVSTDVTDLGGKIEQMARDFKETVEHVFQRKITMAAGWIVGSVPLVIAVITLLEKQFKDTTQAIILAIVGTAILAFTYSLNKRYSDDQHK